MGKFIIGIALAAAIAAAPAAAQRQNSGGTISIYRAAPGHQEALLTWFAKQEEIARSAGVPASVLYVHQDGASWDYLLIAPNTTKEQDAALDAAAAKMGAPSGPKAGLELRKHIAEHTDTIVAGPMTATEWLRRVKQ